MQKTTLIATLALLLGFLLFPTGAFAFDDVDPSHWAYRAVEFLEDEGLAEGYPDGTFGGDRTLTRYEFAMVVARLYNNFMDLVDQGEQPGIDIELVLDQLMAEFQPELDELRDLIADNTARIESLETTVGGFQGSIDEVKKAVDKMNTRFQTFGDFRVRLEGKYPDTGLQTQRPRYRVRWGFNSQITPELLLGTRFATGTDGSITSANKTIDDAFALDTFYVDRAFLQWTPESAPGFTMWAGKFAPPWVTTEMTFGGDVNIEGLAQRFNSDNFNFYLAEMVPTVEGFYLVAQAGVKDIVDGFDAAVTYHFINDKAWKHIMADMQSGDLTSRFIFDRLQSPDDYRAIEGYVSFTTNDDELPIKLIANYLRNLEDAAEQADSAYNQALWVQVTFGKPLSDVGDWQLAGEWGRVQANSALSWLTEPNRGSGDHEWWGAVWSYRMLKNTDLVVTYIDADRISKANSGFDLVQINVSSKI